MALMARGAFAPSEPVSLPPRVNTYCFPAVGTLEPMTVGCEPLEILGSRRECATLLLAPSLPLFVVPVSLFLENGE